MAGEKNHCSVPRELSDGLTVREIVEDWHADPLGRAIPQGFLDLCRIDSDLADQPISYGTGFFMFLFSDVMAKHELAARLRAAGWLPHPVLPIDELVGPEKEPQRIRAAVERYVGSHRDDIYRKLLARFGAYKVEPHACRLAEDAVGAHRAGYFRLIVPSVFPEIERCARTTLGLRGGAKGKPVQDVVKRIEEEVPLSKMDAFLAVEAIKLLAGQMYQSVKSPEECDLVKDMPHRHGALHGLIEYDSSRDGLNALFLLDFVLTACEAITNAPVALPV
ncbi:MAG: hypothetical protein ABSD31_19820 [Candidatus Binataceae bacterium]|jgi:hypothetical protein